MESEAKSAESEGDGMRMEAMGGAAPDLMPAAFISMQPPAMVVNFAREVGGGFITAFAQKFFLDRCFKNEVHLRYPSSQAYVKRVVKALILAAEGDGQEVMEDLYDLYSIFLDVEKDAALAERCYITYTFMIPESARANLRESLGEELDSEMIGTKLVTLRVSLDLLDGDTGYRVWPAGLYLAQVLLSHPQLVQGNSCLELGSGTGICGVWLCMLAPSKVVLTDGALATLVNLRHNLSINGISISDTNGVVDCKQLVWDTVSEEELWSYKARVIFGADLVYDPTIVPQLVRVLAMMLKRNPDAPISPECQDVPVAYLASALRTLTTLHLFFRLAEKAGLEVIDVTQSFMPLRILPDIYDRDSSQIRLYNVKYRIE